MYKRQTTSSTTTIIPNVTAAGVSTSTANPAVTTSGIAAAANTTAYTGQFLTSVLSCITEEHPHQVRAQVRRVLSPHQQALRPPAVS